MKNPEIDQLGTKRWYKEGKLHREDGPAIEWSNGDKAWCTSGKLNRTDGPAFIMVKYLSCWYKDQKLHRLDGPAIIRIDEGTKFWYVDGEEFSEEVYPEAVLRYKCKQVLES